MCYLRLHLIALFIGTLFVTLNETNRSDDEVCTTLNQNLKASEKTATIQLVYDNCQNDYKDDRTFGYDFMTKISSTVVNSKKPNFSENVPTWLAYTQPNKATIEKYRNTYKKALTKKFTLRHYAKTDHPGKPPSYINILSTFGLRKQGIAGQHTNTKDWIYLGNTAFTFWLLCIDGVVPERKFLQDTTHYTEIDVANIRLNDLDFFASQDLLDVAEKLQSGEYKATLMKGKLIDLPPIVLGTIGNRILNNADAATILKFIDNSYKMFEVKIPGSVNNVTWNPK